MSKRFKLKLSLAMPSFQICRLKNDSDKPVPSIFRISTFNRKSYDISYPKLPDPPPTTPELASIKRRVSRKKSSLGCTRRQTRPLAHYLADCSIGSPDYLAFKKVADRSTVKFPTSTLHRLSQSRSAVSFSDDSFDSFSPVLITANPKNKTREKKNRINDETSVCVSSEYDGCCFSSEPEDQSIETETLIFPSGSFSYDSSFDFCHPVKTKIKKSEHASKKLPSKTRIRKLRRQVSKEKNVISSPLRRSVLKKMMMTNNKTDGTVKESVAVVKKSENPYEDFKRSMLEMILEKQMFEENELEELLQCFLSLNSRQYHGVIIEAFSEIWEILFCDSPVKKKNSVKLKA
ncbi:transcription repressor OFP7-like [Mercurialis annua]|uniref:transcription repressor OFP7-like n=1 Tax=Mercurialis annua TaxID=3986 RepID=UPI00215E21E5|nr:transcription repressor OFP7-like [Mercurialis annua]